MKFDLLSTFFNEPDKAHRTTDLTDSEAEVIRTKAANDRTPIELLDAKLFIILTADGEHKHPAIVVWNNSRDVMGGESIYESWLSERYSIQNMDRLFQARLREPADSIGEWQWVVDSLSGRSGSPTQALP